MQKPLTFLYINSKPAEREIKKTIPFTTSSKRINYLGINLIKEMKDLYTGNCKTLMKETEEDVQNGKIFCAHRLEEFILLKCPKQSIDSIQSLSKFQWHFSQNWNK